ncbi:HEPN domain-containing protein [Paramicrobacterium chengjingii]|uniref:HEPN domain-containing protein n=1 Tax=Paramicrobacterium chengjingii TaxID=2769067 RepID=UPI00141E19D7|nr:HEPN domain-containing protein [Microbacterium chengjingii]
MPRLYGADEVHRQQKKLNAVFVLIDGTDISDETRSHYARYLCIRLAGFAEQSLKDLVSAHARNQSTATVHRFVEGRMGKLWGINQTKLKETLDALNPEWWDALVLKLPDEVDALQSVGKLRDNISHGGDSGISLPTVQQYRDSVFRLVAYLCDLLDPKTT